MFAPSRESLDAELQGYIRRAAQWIILGIHAHDIIARIRVVEQRGIKQWEEELVWLGGLVGRVDLRILHGRMCSLSLIVDIFRLYDRAFNRSDQELFASGLEFGLCQKT